MTKPMYRINMENADLAVDQAGNLIQMARIYGSRILMEDMFKTMKKEYNSEVGKGYYAGVNQDGSYSLMRGLEITDENKGIREIRVKNGSAGLVPQNNMSPGTKTNVGDILDMIQKGWKIDPSNRKMFRLGPGRANINGVVGGWMQTSTQRPKPFVDKTLKLYQGVGINSAKGIMEREMAKKLGGK